MRGTNFEDEEIINESYDAVVYNVPITWDWEKKAARAIEQINYSHLVLLMPELTEARRKTIEKAIEKRGCEILFEDVMPAVPVRYGDAMTMHVIVISHDAIFSAEFRKKGSDAWLEEKIGKTFHMEQESYLYPEEDFNRLVRNDGLFKERILSSYKKKSMEIDRAMNQIANLSPLAVQMLDKHYQRPTDNEMFDRFRHAVLNNNMWHWKAFDKVMLNLLPFLGKDEKNQIEIKIADNRYLSVTQENMEQRRRWINSMAKELRDKMYFTLFANLSTKENVDNINEESEQWAKDLSDKSRRYTKYGYIDFDKIAHEKGSYIKTNEIVLENQYNFCTNGHHEFASASLEKLYSMIKAAAVSFGYRIIDTEEKLPDYCRNWNVSIVDNNLSIIANLKAYKYGKLVIHLDPYFINSLNARVAVLRGDDMENPDSLEN